LRGHSGDEIRTSFLGREAHQSSIYERPVASATGLPAMLPMCRVPQRLAP
jgi:hypothetical protein